MLIRESLSFDDVLLKPKYSDVPTRSLINTTVKVGGFKFKVPFVPANMKTVTSIDMARYMIKLGGLAILHRFSEGDEQLEIFLKLVGESWHNRNHIGLSIGVKKEDYAKVDSYISRGARIICVDVAHGHSRSAHEMCSYINNRHKNVLIIAGNVATYDGAKMLWSAGAHVVKVGIGSGSICTTRIETGCGVPQLTALLDVVEGRKNYKLEETFGRKLYVMSDGGIRTPGDAAKALCIADMVMIGSAFAGTDEAPGELVTYAGSTHKSYNGSSTHKLSRKEGVEAFVPHKGSMEKVMTRFVEGLQSCCSYQGVTNLSDLKSDPQFIRVTNAGLVESQPHVSMVGHIGS